MIASLPATSSQPRSRPWLPRANPAPRRRRAANGRRERRGYTLVLWAMLMFGIMGLAALVIDVGFVRLTQHQLQSAADSAALEGLRGEGPHLFPVSYTYADRVAASRAVVVQTFDDDLNGDGLGMASDLGAFGTGSGKFGAGPLVSFSGGVGEPGWGASQLLEVDSNNPVYKPEVLDGVASPAGSFLFRVALERGAAAVPDADLYSSGPAVPYLFARGSLLSRSLLTAGVTVRGAGRAHAERAVSVGLPQTATARPLPGIAPLALELSFWNGLQSGNASTHPVVAGELGTNGRFFTLTTTAATLPLTLGRTLPPAAPPTDDSWTGYVPIYSPIGASATPRVIGFGTIQVVVSGNGTSATLTPLASCVATENASAVPCFSLALSSADANEVWAARQQVVEPLWAPVTGSLP